MKKIEIQNIIERWLKSNIEADDGVTIKIDRIRQKDNPNNGQREKIEYELNTKVDEE